MPVIAVPLDRDAIAQASRGRVDLLTTESLRHPYLRASVLPTAVDVYAACV